MCGLVNTLKPRWRHKPLRPQRPAQRFLAARAAFALSPGFDKAYDKVLAARVALSPSPCCPRTANRIRAACVVLFTPMLLLTPVRAQDGIPSEYQVEAAFLYHFTEFVSWPPDAFSSPTGPLTIGIAGDDPVAQELEGMIKNKSVRDHPIRVLRLESKAFSEARGCQMIFVSASERRRLRELFQALKGAPVLTVSRMDGFLVNGGMINFVIEDKKVRFEINDQAAQQAGLKISAKLLTLARRKTS